MNNVMMTANTADAMGVAVIAAAVVAFGDGGSAFIEGFGGIIG